MRICSLAMMISCGKAKDGRREEEGEEAPHCNCDRNSRVGFRGFATFSACGNWCLRLRPAVFFFCYFLITTLSFCSWTSYFDHGRPRRYVGDIWFVFRVLQLLR